MAPTKRKSLRAKASAAAKPTTTTSSTSYSSTTTTPSSAAPTSVADTSPFPSFSSTKRDKRSIKHSLLLSKLSTSAPNSSAGVKKRRRPNKKLVTSLDALADALPDSSAAAAASQHAAEGAEDAATAIDVPGAQARIVVKGRSLKSRPGALRRKKAVEDRERLRFERNLAEMARGVPAAAAGQEQEQQVPDVGMAEEAAAAVGGGGAVASTADRWKALRAFIGGTMEKR
ncbi:ribosome biogenesis protein SLX9-domain-containing protein [Phyllosticta capitalensis]